MCVRAMALSTTHLSAQRVGGGGRVQGFFRARRRPPFAPQPKRFGRASSSSPPPPCHLLRRCVSVAHGAVSRLRRRGCVCFFKKGKRLFVPTRDPTAATTKRKGIYALALMLRVVGTGPFSARKQKSGKEGAAAGGWGAPRVAAAPSPCRGLPAMFFWRRVRISKKEGMRAGRAVVGGRGSGGAVWSPSCDRRAAAGSRCERQPARVSFKILVVRAKLV
jgi:hypothetical protein